MVYASEISRDLDDARGQGWTIPRRSFDWASFHRCQGQGDRAAVGRRTRRACRRPASRDRGPRARSPIRTRSRSDGERITAANILVATGGKPRVPRPAADHLRRSVSSARAAEADRDPRRAATSAIEFAHIFAGFGAKVTLVHRGEHVLRGFDPDVRASRSSATSRRTASTLVHAAITSTASSDDLAMARDRPRAASAELGLVEAGVVLDDRGAVVVDEWSRTNVPHIYAVGDVTVRFAAHAGRDPRRPRGRRHAVWQAPDADQARAASRPRCSRSRRSRRSA